MPWTQEQTDRYIADIRGVLERKVEPLNLNGQRSTMHRIIVNEWVDYGTWLADYQFERMLRSVGDPAVRDRVRDMRTPFANGFGRLIGNFILVSLRAERDGEIVTSYDQLTRPAQKSIREQLAVDYVDANIIVGNEKQGMTYSPALHRSPAELRSIMNSRTASFLPVFQRQKFLVDYPYRTRDALKRMRGIFDEARADPRFPNVTDYQMALATMKFSESLDRFLEDVHYATAHSSKKGLRVHLTDFDYFQAFLRNRKNPGVEIQRRVNGFARWGHDSPHLSRPLTVAA